MLLSVLLLATAILCVGPVTVASASATITVPDDYPKIQDAVSAAAEGDTVFVKAGTYNEDYVALDKPVSLVGDNQKSVIVYHSSLGLTITANNVHVSGFTLTNIETGKGHAIDIAASIGCIIEDNLIEDNLVGISVYGASSDNTVSGNVLRNNERSIELIDASDNIISNNNISSALVSGISLDVSSGNTVSGNRISDLVDGMGALMLWKSSNNIVSGNSLFGGNPMLMIECEDNTLTENFVMNSDYGVVIGASSNNKLYSNYFINVAQQVLDTEEGGQFSENSWDNGVEGNYWSSYNGTDSNKDGIGDTAQVLYGNNQDNYPLMNYPSSSSDPEQSSIESGFPTEIIIGILIAAAVIVGVVAAIKLRKK